MERNIKQYSLKTIVITAAASALIAFAVTSFTGFQGGGRSDLHDHANNASQEEALYTCSMHPSVIKNEPGACPLCGMDLVPVKSDGGAGSAPTENKIAYWQAPMNPSEIYDKPGKSAMGMDLVPVYEHALAGGVQITVDPTTIQNMGIRTAEAKKEQLSHTIRTYGHITYDETRVYQINLRYSGWIEEIHVDYTGKEVRKGEPLFTVYSPELITAQEEYLEALKGKDRFGKKLTESALRRLENYKISQQEIKQIAKTRKVKNSLTIRSPYTGFVVAKNISKGSFFKSGTTVYQLADISTVWVEAHIYEYEIPLVAPGMAAEMSLAYFPEKTYSGKVSYIYPYLEKKARDVVIRIEFENIDRLLKPDMYADVRISTLENKTGITIPAESVLRSGDTNIVFISESNGRFIPRNVIPGILLDNEKVQILSGIAPGERVVTSGQFMLDSESKLKEAIAKLIEPEKIIEKPDEAANDSFFDDME